jgi:hypothetical protein
MSPNKLNSSIQEYKKLLEKMEALEALIPNCPPELLAQHSREISEQEETCRNFDVEAMILKSHTGHQNDEEANYRLLFETMEAVAHLNQKISKSLKATMLITAEELKNLKKTMPGIAGYANIQNTAQRPILKQQG